MSSRSENGLAGIVSILAGRSRWIIILGTFAGLIAGIGGSALVALVYSASSNSRPVTAAMIWLFVGLCILTPTSRIAADWIWVHLGQDVVYELRRELTRLVPRAPLRSFEELKDHQVLAVMGYDIFLIANTVQLLPIAFVQIATLVTCLVILVVLDVHLFVKVAPLLALGIVSYQWSVKQSLRFLRRARDSEDLLTKHLRALTEGIKELKLHRARRESFFDDLLQPNLMSIRRDYVKGMAINAATVSWGQLVVFIVLGLTVFLFSSKSPAVIGYCMTIMFMAAPLQGLMNTIPHLQRANIALQKIKGLRAALASPEPQCAAKASRREFESLELRGVLHAYRQESDDGNFQLGPIDLKFTRGELVFLVGGNGSGKTTLAKLITGLYVQEEGRILLNGRTVDDTNRENYREQFSAIFADFHVFESLLGFDPQHIDKRAHAYLELLELHHKLRIEDGHFSTTELSRGQVKRLALLTAYLEDRPFYVFDEWAADQDPAFKRFFYLRLLPDMKLRNKTALVITHDDRYYSVADRIVRLSQGQVTSISEGGPSTDTAYVESVR